MALTDGVTVIIPVRDRAAVLRRALASVLAQSLPPAQVIVIDDASEDPGVRSVAEGAGAVVLRLDENRGAAHARNVGLAATTTTWVAFLDSDDEWMPEHLEVLVAHSSRHVLVGAPARRVPSGRIIGNAGGRPLDLTPERLLIPSNPVATSAVMVRREAALAAGGFGSRSHAEDLELWINVLDQGRGLVLGRPTAIYHEHGGQASAARDLMRRHVREVVLGCRHRPWYSPAITRRLEVVLAWDDLRSAVRVRAGRPLLGAALRLARWAPQWPTLAALLTERWQSRNFRLRRPR